MEYTDIEKMSIGNNELNEDINLTIFTSPDDDDEYATPEELADLEDTMFPDGIDDDNYPDLSDSD